MTLTANDQARIGPTGPHRAAAGELRGDAVPLSAVDVLVLPWLIGHVNPRALTTFRVIGWEPFRRVYAHYFLNGKRIKTVEIGSVSGPCGDMTKKVRQFPSGRCPPGATGSASPARTFYDPQGFWIGYRDVVVAKAKAVR